MSLGEAHFSPRLHKVPAKQHVAGAIYRATIAVPVSPLDSTREQPSYLLVHVLSARPGSAEAGTCRGEPGRRKRGGLLCLRSDILLMMLQARQSLASITSWLCLGREHVFAFVHMCVFMYACTDAQYCQFTSMRSCVDACGWVGR